MTSENRNPKVDAYISTAAEFARPVMGHLRNLIHDTCPQVEEQLKWGIPHFDYHGEMMCIFAAYSNHCSFSFWKDSLMSDQRLNQNPTLKAPKRFMGKLTSMEDLPPDDEITGFIREAMALNEQGVKLLARKSKVSGIVEMPESLAAALRAHPDAEAIFHGKSASFRKEYMVWIGDAKTDATRQKRLDEAIAWIALGKGRFWKYQKA